MATRIFAAIALLILVGAPVRAAQPVALPMAVGLSEARPKSARYCVPIWLPPGTTPKRAVEERIQTFSRSFADAQSRELLDASREAQLRFDDDEALI